MNNNVTDWIQLIHSENIGPITFFQLQQRYGSVSAALDALPHIAARGGKKDFRIFPKDEAEKTLEKAIKLLCF